jgi:alkanesulfonate monooxygenase SsuD/methylene tetrahydromethanopterin reductase-like flavin-dependent oxidoreductase (luciferase family)
MTNEVKGSGATEPYGDRMAGSTDGGRQRDELADSTHHRPFGRRDLYTERAVAHPPDGTEITVGLRVPHELPGGAAGLREFAARVEATRIDRVFVGDHVAFKGGQGFDGLVNATAVAVASRRLVVQTAADAGRPVAGWQHGMHVWCGLGASASPARARLAAVMEEFYRVPFGKFERYCPCGTPEQVADGLRLYADAGCRSFNLIPVADGEQAAIEGAEAVRALLARGDDPPDPPARAWPGRSGDD